MYVASKGPINVYPKNVETWREPAVGSDLKRSAFFLTINVRLGEFHSGTYTTWHEMCATSDRSLLPEATEEIPENGFAIPEAQ